MRKFFLGATLVAASFGMAQSADAATVMGQSYRQHYRVYSGSIR